MIDYKPRNWDINGWSVDCVPGDVVVRCADCPRCAFHASAASQDGVDAALVDHHHTTHLPNAEYLAHTARHP